ncbi:MAG: dockerin type I repeat-containing protein [Muribaculaceae bacterium]|nr:dockerin type I repeat-containing protein [Muribaculaceae bacterium]
MKRTRNILVAACVLMTAVSLWANHPWLTRVYEYRPAPGQFINTLPVARVGEPVDSVLARCRASICGRIDTVSYTFHGELITRIDTVWAEGMISLGGYGGYVIVGFDHPVVNMHTWDFEIQGNAFYSDMMVSGGSCEPGIVMVGVDMDGDGVPSEGDKWYELAGSDYSHPKTQHDYAITYYRPDENKPRTPSQTDPSLIDTTYIRWTSNDVNPDSTSGYMSRNSFHMQPYWPLWLQDEETLTFTGTKLRCNAEDIGGNDGNAYFVQYCFPWGYVDNLPNHPGHQPGVEGYNPGFKIDWAVDEDGNHVNLTHIDFIKVYNAVNQYCGWIGETSTEVAAGIDFHPDAVLPAVLPGDVNGDGEVSVSDVNAVIDIILVDGSLSSADVNGDGEVTVSDINALINLILQ